MLKRLLLIGFVFLLGLGLLDDKIMAANHQNLKRVPVLTYHHIDSVESAYTITPERFHRHLQTIRDHHFNVISMDDFISHQQTGTPLPPNPVVLTFDDGYESFYRYAYPELKKMGMTATVFLIVSYVDHDPNFLTWSQVQTMKKDGFSFYSHTNDLHKLRSDGSNDVWPLANPIWNEQEKRMETQAEYESRVKADLSEADRTLREKVGNRLSLLCFPGGVYNENVLRLGDELGIQYFFSGHDGTNNSHERLIKRINAGSPNMDEKSLARRLNRCVTAIDKVKQRVYNLLVHHK